MTVVTYGRFGWFDSVGPLLFLRERWTCGPGWRPCWARFFAGPIGIAMQSHTKKRGHAVSGFVCSKAVWEDLSYAQKEDMVMGWLKQVRRPDGANGSGGLAVDPQWVSEFPAVHEFLTMGTHPDGTPRRTSTITLFAEHGSFKLYLNERDAGASLCATGSSVQDALTALETMLESENTPWRFSDRPEAPPPRKGRRGP